MKKKSRQMQFNILVVSRPICWFWELKHNFPFFGLLDGYWMSAGHAWREMESNAPIGYGPLQCDRCGLVNKVKEVIV